MKPPENPARLVPLESPVGVELVLEDPLACDHVRLQWSGHKIPSVVLQKGGVFLLHSSPPTRVSKGTTEGLGHRRQLSDMKQGWDVEATLGARLHGVLVGHRWNGDNTLGERRGRRWR